jgi:hypothetical protein
MAIHPVTTAELQVYLTHFTHGGCEFGIDHLPCFLFMNFPSQFNKEKILWTSYVQRQFEDLEKISKLSFRDFVACLEAQSGSKDN